MSIQKIKEASEKILNRLQAVIGRGEEATKQALILPMFEALGYDIWNPAEVCPEYEADFAIKKIGQKEKVDYAIILNNVPRIYIEVKPYKTNLADHHGQLARYFNATPTVSLGIITNGTEYKLFTDSGEPNIMDAEPFHIVNLEIADQGLEIFARFQRAVFSPEAIRDFATELNYTAKMVNFFRGQLDLRDSEPSDNIVRWTLGSDNMFDGRVTTNVLERFRPIVKQALQRVIREIVRRSVAALDEGVSAPLAGNSTQASMVSEVSIVTTESQGAVMAAIDDAENRGRINTTEQELECFAIIKHMFESSELANSTIYDSTNRKDVPAEIAYKDTSAYFVVYFNKPSLWIARIGIESRKPWIGFDLDLEQAKPILPLGHDVMEPSAYAKLRLTINSPQELKNLIRVIGMAMQRVMANQQQGVKPHGIIEPA